MRDLLRDVNIDGYRLTTWDTGRVDRYGKSELAYRFCDKAGEVLFEGEDFCCSPMHAIDSDESLRALLSFLTLQPGDTDRSYFDDYTEAQMDFARGDAESLQLYTLDEESACCDDCVDPHRSCACEDADCACHTSRFIDWAESEVDHA